MITELIERLKNYAQILEDTTTNNGSADLMCIKTMREAAAVIYELSSKLHDANMERSSQYYHGGWIPCEECLPEENDVVLVQSSRRMANEEHDFITIARYENTHFWSRFGWNPYANIIAWRPLPEEYRGE